MKNIAVTGISGYIGTKLLAYLDCMDDVQKIVCIDTRESRLKSTKLSTDRLKKELGYGFQYSTKEALSSFVASLNTG